MLVERARALAEKKGCKPGQLALAWVLAKGEGLVPIAGTKKRRYLEENLAAAEIELKADEVKEVEAAVPVGAVVGDRYNAGGMKTIDK